MSWINDFKTRRDVLITAINGGERAIQELHDQIAGHRQAIAGHQAEMDAIERALNINSNGYQQPAPPAMAQVAPPMPAQAPAPMPGNGAPPQGAPAWGRKPPAALDTETKD